MFFCSLLLPVINRSLSLSLNQTSRSHNNNDTSTVPRAPSTTTEDAHKPFFHRRNSNDTEKKKERSDQSIATLARHAHDAAPRLAAAAGARDPFAVGQAHHRPARRHPGEAGAFLCCCSPSRPKKRGTLVHSLPQPITRAEMLGRSCARRLVRGRAPTQVAWFGRRRGKNSSEDKDLRPNPLNRRSLPSTTTKPNRPPAVAAASPRRTMSRSRP